MKQIVCVSVFEREREREGGKAKVENKTEKNAKFSPDVRGLNITTC